MEQTERTTPAIAALLVHARARSAIAAGFEDELAQLRRLSVVKRLFELVVFSALWAGGVTLVLTALGGLDPGPLQYVLRAVGTLVAAVAINAFVLLLHEGMHHTLFVSRFWNRWVSVLLGAPVLMSFSAYRVLHWRHHAYLGDPRDPDDYHHYTARPWLVWLMHFLRLCLGAFLYIFLIPRLALRHGSRQDRRDIVAEYLFLALLWGTLAVVVPGPWLLHGWLLPALLTGLMTNVRGFAQHGITDATDPYLASRTLTAHPVVAFCLLNENYHLEHHFFPEVPSYHLPRLHRLMWQRLPRAVTGRSYLGFLGRFLRAAWRMDESPIGLTHPGGTP